MVKRLHVEHDLSCEDVIALSVGLATEADVATPVADILMKSSEDDGDEVMFDGEEQIVARVTSTIQELLDVLTLSAMNLLEQDSLWDTPVTPARLWAIVDALRRAGGNFLLGQSDAFWTLAQNHTELESPVSAIHSGFMKPVPGVFVPAHMNSFITEKAQLDVMALLDQRLAVLPQKLATAVRPTLDKASNLETINWRDVRSLARKVLGYSIDLDRFAVSEVRFAYALGQLAAMSKVGTGHCTVHVSANACKLCRTMLGGKIFSVREQWETLKETNGYQPSHRGDWRPFVPLHPHCACYYQPFVDTPS